MNVTNQKHYLLKVGDKEVNSISVISSIINNLKLEGEEAFYIGNVLKYVIRYKNKNGQEDLRKAITYLEYCLGIKSRQELEEGLKKEIIDLHNQCLELENLLDSKAVEIHNLKIDLEKMKNDTK